MEKEIEQFNEGESELTLPYYYLNNDGLLTYEYTFYSNSSGAHTEVFSRPINDDIIHCFRKDRMEEREMAAINCYLMGKDKVFDKDFTSPNAYTSMYLRGFRMSEQLRKLVMKPRKIEEDFLSELRKKHIRMEKHKTQTCVFVSRHNCILEIPTSMLTMDEFIDALTFVDTYEWHDSMIQMSPDVDFEIVKKNIMRKALTRPKIYVSVKRTCDFINMSEDEFRAKYRAQKYAYEKKYEQFCKYIQTHSNFKP